jgi:ABC-type uncharacterized transport system permease subunit
LPFPYMYNLPLSILSSDRVDVSGWARGFGVQLIWVITIYALARAYFNFSLKKLTVNGG